MTTIELKDVICKECNLPHSLDENGLCSFCRRPMEPFEDKPRYDDRDSLKNLFVVIGVVAMAYFLFTLAHSMAKGIW